MPIKLYRDLKKKLLKDCWGNRFTKEYEIKLDEII